MTWSLTTGKSIVLADGQFQTECTIDDGIKPYVDHLSYPPGSDPVAALEARGRQRVAMQDAVTKPPTLIPVGTIIDLSPPLPPEPSPPTQADKDRDAWVVLYTAERTQELLATKSDAVRNGYKPEYGPLR